MSLAIRIIRIGFLAYAVIAIAVALVAAIIGEWQTAAAYAGSGLMIGLLFWFLPKLALRRTFADD